MSTLWIVATPIGNLEDITLRALNTLKAADVIACEDTRHSSKLLSHYSISKPLISCYAFEEKRGVASVLSRLNKGENVAYVSDAGTPSLSDPGSMLAAAAREAGHSVVPIPGPSAFATLLSVAGMGGKSVLFEGFLSPKPGRRRNRVAELMSRDEAVVFYESPFRVLKLLADIADIDPERRVAVGRELTKIYEEIVVNTSSAVLAEFSSRKEQKGEFAVLVAGKGKNQAPEADEGPEND
jgi:16S rRNA (cytidine1402-2'-O)-methyltransferase